MARLERLELPYLTPIAGECRLPAATVAAVIANDVPALKAADISFLFDVPTETATAMRRRFMCDRHIGISICLRPSCFGQYIAKHYAGDVNPWEWYARRMRDHEPLVTTEGVGVQLPAVNGTTVWRSFAADA
jgi:hypothetical protein